MSGPYHGTQQLNQARPDRRHFTGRLDELEEARAIEMIPGKAPWLAGSKALARMVRMAGLTRTGYRAGGVSAVMSPRTVLSGAGNARSFGVIDFGFRPACLNRCDRTERGAIAEYCQRCFGPGLSELPESRRSPRVEVTA